jgi:hypothetical protein
LLTNQEHSTAQTDVDPTNRFTILEEGDNPVLESLALRSGLALNFYYRRSHSYSTTVVRLEDLEGRENVPLFNRHVIWVDVASLQLCEPLIGSSTGAKGIEYLSECISSFVNDQL